MEENKASQGMSMRTLIKTCQTDYTNQDQNRTG